MCIISRQILVPVFLTLAAANVFAQGDQVDLLIQNARVVDGTGSPWFRSDVAINNGRIVDIGVDLNIDATQTIDAAGRVVAPGFIDVHTHVESSESREGLQRLPRADNYLLDAHAATLASLRSMGVNLQPIQLPRHAGMDVLQILLVDEAAAFDELIQTGKVDLLIQDRDEPEDMLMRVARLLPAVEYVQIHRLRMLMMQGMEKALRDIDVYVSPHVGSANTSATSLTGHPAISVPNGFDDAGKPTGILFVGKLYGEADMMAAARAYQDANDFHLAHPDMDRAKKMASRPT